MTEGALAGGRTPPTRLASRLLCGVAAVVALGLVGEAIWPAPAYANAGERIVGLFAAAFVTVSMAVCLSVVAVGFSMTVFEAAAGLVRGGARVIDRRLHPPPPPEPVAPEPEVVEFWSPTPIEGWRLWVWNGSELKGYWQYWPRSSLVSKCVKCAEVPGEDHRCGVNAYKERSQIPARFHVDEGESVVHGRVLLTGLVIEHELGYRAERARIAELFVAADISDAVQARYPDVVVTRHHPLPPDQEYGDW